MLKDRIGCLSLFLNRLRAGCSDRRCLLGWVFFGVGEGLWDGDGVVRVG